MDMKKTILTISFASIIAVAPTTTLAQETVEQDVGNRIVQRLERDLINDQLHAKTHQAQDNGRHAPANWLDRKGNRIDRKLDRKGDLINDRLDAKAHWDRNNGRHALAKRLYLNGGQINDRLHTKTHRVPDNKRYALAKRLYRNGGQISNRIHAGRNNQRRDWIRSRNNQSKQRFSSFRNTQRFHRSQGHAQSTRRLARR